MPEELKMLRETARKFAEEHIAPHAQEWDREEYYPDAMIKKLGDQGFMGILVPEEYGGAGLDPISYALVIAEISAADAAHGTIISANNFWATFRNLSHRPFPGPCRRMSRVRLRRR